MITENDLIGKIEHFGGRETLQDFFIYATTFSGQ